MTDQKMPEIEADKLTDLEQLMVLASGVADMANAAVKGIQSKPAKVYRDIGVYVEHQGSVITAGGGQNKIELVGVKIPIDLAMSLAKVVTQVKTSDEGRALSAKIGKITGGQIIGTIGSGRVM